MQTATIPLLLKNQNVFVSAPTGTGKTLAFLIPLLQRIDCSSPTVQALIVTPTRELATQIAKVARVFSAHKPALQVRLLTGGAQTSVQLQKLRAQPPHLIITTPGRLLALLRAGAGKGFLASLRYIVYDEADMLIDAGFINEYKALHDQLSKHVRPVQAVFSATLHQALRDRFKQLIPRAQQVVIAPQPQQRAKIKHYAVVGAAGDRFVQLHAITKQIRPYLCLVFVPNQQVANDLTTKMRDAGIACLKLHGGMEASARKQAFAALRALTYPYAIVTDLIARGIDLPGASHVISWGIPHERAWYLHRAGRCGRAGTTGISYVLLDATEERTAATKLPADFAWSYLRVNAANELKVTTAPHQVKHKIKHSPATLLALKKVVLQTQKQPVQPNVRKHAKIAVKKILQREKRAAIDAKIKAVLRRKAKTRQNP